MKIEFLPDGAEDCPLIRLFWFTSEEVSLLCQACQDLADGRIEDYALHDLAWVEPIADCRFYWRLHQKNIGVNLPDTDAEFVLLLNEEGWREVEEILRVFEGAICCGFNWLTVEGDVSVLFSHDGGW